MKNQVVAGFVFIAFICAMAYGAHRDSTYDARMKSRHVEACECCEMFKKLEECRQQLHRRKQILRILAEEKSERGEYVNPELYEEPTP